MLYAFCLQARLVFAGDKYFIYIMELKKAKRQQVKLRMGLSAVSGGGKTYSALQLAYGMTRDWSKIAVIDTENGSASLYSHLGEFQTIGLEAPYTPERYIQAIKMCEDAGMEVIIVDSITHEWDGKGGMLEIHSSMTGNSFTNWSSLTPRHQKFIDAILQSKSHVITTVRRKQDYEMTLNDKGKQTPVKVGLKEVTREGFEYELTVNFNLESNHMVTASKDRTGLFMDQPQFIITPETGKLLMDWCNSGEVAPVPFTFQTAEEQQKTVLSVIEKMTTCKDLKSMAQYFNSLDLKIQQVESVKGAAAAKKLEFTNPQTT